MNRRRLILSFACSRKRSICIYLYSCLRPWCLPSHGIALTFEQFLSKSETIVTWCIKGSDLGKLDFL